MYFSQPEGPPQGQIDTTTTEQKVGEVSKDTTKASEEPVQASQPELIEPQPEALLDQATSAIFSDSTEKVITLVTDLVDAKISNQNGGRITQWQLKKYDDYYGGKVDLVSGNERYNVPENGLDIELMNRDGKIIHISDYNLKVNVANDTSIFLDESNPTAELEFYLPIEGGRLIKKYVFHHDKYSADVIVAFENLQGYLGPQRWYSVKWENGLPATEENVSEDYDYARAYAYQNGEMTEYDVSEDKEKSKYPSGPSTGWIAIRTKYFLSSIIPANSEGLNVELAGYGFERNDNLIKVFSTVLGVSLPSPMSALHADSFQVYLGPVDYSVLKSYDVDLQTLVMSKGWYEEYLRFISIPILQAFKLLHSFIPNYGFVIILFSILIKIILHPLTKKSYQSMSEMQYVQPEMTQLREKYKNDPQRLNKEMMKLYKEHGINPLGGCLPTLLQMPLLFALFNVFRSTIQLRGEPFILWMTDLSRPDTLLTLNFSIPFLGNSLHVLPFLMGATMIWQSKMTMTDPKQKAMIYLMPVFMIFIFYSLPSGLNLYYAVFNVLSMFQTRMIKKKMHPDNSGTRDAKSVKEAPKTPPQRSKAQRSKKRKR
jgi:YidC/Oxa1 family membrane protein insertase